MSNYKGQISTVLHYINQQVQQDWTGADSNAFNGATHRDVLAEIACMSTRNFQVYFKSYLNETYGAYIDRIRLEYALQLLQDGDLSNAQIAERIGYANDTALYNVIKKKQNTTPSQYKMEIEEQFQPSALIVDYRLEILEEKQVLFLSYIGDYNHLSSSIFEENSWNKLYDFAHAQNILPDDEEYWGICYDNTNITDSDKCRFYACLVINEHFRTKLTNEIKSMVIPSAQYAVFTHLGAYEDLDEFYNHAIQTISEDYQLSDDLILEHYVNSPTDIPIDKLITELWIPITKR